MRGLEAGREGGREGVPPVAMTTLRAVKEVRECVVVCLDVTSKEVAGVPRGRMEMADWLYWTCGVKCEAHQDM